MNYLCGIIEDLLPLYLDGACSEESKAAIEAHVKACDACYNKLAIMKVDDIIPDVPKVNSENTMAKYAQKVKRHRIRRAIGVVFTAVIAAFVLALVFLTIKDMHNQANPVIHEVEEGIYNLTDNNLKVTAAELEECVFYTNNTMIEVSVDKDVGFSGEVLLWTVHDNSDPYPSQYGEITPDERSCTFKNLISVDRYMITCDGNEDLMLTVTDGRRISFFGSMRNVLNEIMVMIMEL